MQTRDAKEIAKIKSHQAFFESVFQNIDLFNRFLQDSDNYGLPEITDELATLISHRQHYQECKSDPSRLPDNVYPYFVKLTKNNFMSALEGIWAQHLDNINKASDILEDRHELFQVVFVNTEERRKWKENDKKLAKQLVKLHGAIKEAIEAKEFPRLISEFENISPDTDQIKKILCSNGLLSQTLLNNQDLIIELDINLSNYQKKPASIKNEIKSEQKIEKESKQTFFKAEKNQNLLKKDRALELLSKHADFFAAHFIDPDKFNIWAEQKENINSMSELSNAINAAFSKENGINKSYNQYRKALTVIGKSGAVLHFDEKKMNDVLATNQQQIIHW